MSNLSSKGKNNPLGQFAIYIVLVVLVLVIGLINPSFLQISNLVNILQTASIRIIIALGIISILITKGVDLSAGRVVGLGAVISASMLQRPDYEYKFFTDLGIVPLFVPIIIAILVGGGIGLINGISVAFFSIPPFIATLGTMVIAYGASLIYTKAQPIGGLRDDFTQLGSGRLFNTVPIAVILMVIFAAVHWYLLNKTRFGKNIYAVGGNPAAAEVSGINVKGILLAVYVIGGAFYCFAGSLLAAKTGGATSGYGTMYELDAIAACTIGGVSTSGGIGRVSSAITGVLIFEVLNNGLVILGVDSYWQQIIKGVIIILAVGLDIRKYLIKK